MSVFLRYDEFYGLVYTVKVTIPLLRFAIFESSWKVRFITLHLTVNTYKNLS